MRRVPWLVPVYRHVKTLTEIAYTGLVADPVSSADAAHLNHIWDLAGSPARDRNARIIALIGSHVSTSKWGNVLEVGCSEGIFTIDLASHSNMVVAIDISKIACERALERCSEKPNIRVIQRDIASGNIDGAFDVVVAMDVLDFFHGSHQLGKVVTKLVSVLQPSGLLVLSEPRLPNDMRTVWWARWLVKGGDQISDFICQQTGIRRLHQEFHPPGGSSFPGYCDHVIALFRKEA